MRYANSPSNTVCPSSGRIAHSITHASASSRDAVAHCIHCAACSITDASNPALYFFRDPIIVRHCGKNLLHDLRLFSLRVSCKRSRLSLSFDEAHIPPSPCSNQESTPVRTSYFQPKANKARTYVMGHSRAYLNVLDLLFGAPVFYCAGIRSGIRCSTTSTVAHPANKLVLHKNARK